MRVHLAGPRRVSTEGDALTDDASLSPQDGYTSLSPEDQVELLRAVAVEGAEAFGIEPVVVELVLHGFNTTFKVVGTDQVPVAVRVNTNSFSTPAHVIAHSTWMRDLARDTDLTLPVPLLTADGHTFVEVEGRIVTAASWLEGPDVDECEPVHARALGRAMALMHDHARRWVMPDGGALTTYDDPLLGDEDRLTQAYDGRAEDQSLVDWAFARCSRAMEEAAAAEPTIVVHGDLHGGNLKWHEGRLAIFDFDDCGLAVRSFDLATTMFYLRTGTEDVEQALREGYSSVLDLPDTDPDTFEAIVASRQLLLANDLLRTSNAELMEMADEYLDRTVRRLRRWRESGRFTL